MDKRRWVGLDVGEKCTAICALDSLDCLQLECSTGSSPRQIADGLSAYDIRDIVSVVMESGAPTQLQRDLVELGLPISVLDARKTHQFLSIQHHKTDLNDARALAGIARLGNFSHLTVHRRSDLAQQVRNQLVIRSRLIIIRGAIRNSLRSMLRNHGSQIRQTSRGRSLRDIVQAELNLLATRGNLKAAEQLLPLLDIWEAVLTYTDHIDSTLGEDAASNPITRRLMQIPGVGPVCATSFYATIDDPYRFERSADVGAYLGMVPHLKQSGSMTKRGPITKKGHAMTRSYLVLAAGVMMSRAAQHCAIRDWGVDLAQRIGFRKARLAVARKLAVLMLSLWKTNTDFNAYPNRS